MFLLTDKPIQIPAQDHDGAGGFVTFEGKVRNHADGRAVHRLEYEAYPELAQNEGDKLVAEAIARFALLAVSVIHRVGVMEIGETAVLIQVASAHRREAFAGCEWIIDQLKIRVPIWKKETYQEGDSGWIGADVLAPDETFNSLFTTRQRTLEEVGDNGQEKLRNSRVLLVGVGGLGSASLPYLVGAGVGTLGLVDSDSIDPTNLHRQVIYQAQDAGRSKVERAAAFSKRLNPGVTIETFPYQLDESNVDSLVQAYDWIVDGTDSLAIKSLLNAACRRHRKILVSASVHRFEGQILTVTPDGPCLQCLFPEPPPEKCVGTCAETGILGVVPGLLGLLQANDVLKGILGYGALLSESMLLVDLRTGETTSLRRSKRAGCPGCAGQLPSSTEDLEVNSLQECPEYLVVDIREFDELPELGIPHIRTPLSTFNRSVLTRPAVLICASGARSYRLVAQLRAEGFNEIFSLRGGVMEHSIA